MLLAGVAHRLPRATRAAVPPCNNKVGTIDQGSVALVVYAMAILRGYVANLIGLIKHCVVELLVMLRESRSKLGVGDICLESNLGVAVAKLENDKGGSEVEALGHAHTEYPSTRCYELLEALDNCAVVAAVVVPMACEGYG